MVIPRSKNPGRRVPPSNRRFLGVRKKELEVPRYGWLPPIKNVQVMTQSHCSCDCLFCPWSESDHAVNRPGRMTDKVWNLILDNLMPFKDGIETGKFCPYLMNEPLLDKTIFNKIDDIYGCFPNTCVEVSTNGAALTERAVDSLFERFEGKKHDIWVSHHGIDEKTFTHIMAQDYERATKNLINLLHKSDGKFTIKIRGAGQSCDGKHTYFTKDQYLAYWKQKFEEYQINPVNVSIDAFLFHDRAGTLHREDRGANLLNIGIVRKIDPQHSFYCCRIDEWIHFMWNGKIRLCCMDYHAEVDLPSVVNMSLLDYFHGPEYTELVEKVSGRKGCEPGYICTRCISPGG
jgi:hypothetical protein